MLDLTRHNSPAASGASRRDGRPAAVEIAELDVRAAAFRLHVEAVSLPAGSATAIVGSNGSGKSTLVETLLGLRQPTSLRATIFGAPAADWHRDARRRRRLGVQLQQGMYPSQLTPPELLGLQRAMFARAEPSVGALLGISQMGRRPYRDLSYGQKQRLNLYMALAHRPDLAVLDEPFTGLDRKFSEGLASIIEARGDGTLLFVCHTAQELALADRLLWVRDGRVAFDGAIDEALESLCGRACVALALPSASDAQAFAAEASLWAEASRIEWLGARRFAVFGDPALRPIVQRTIDADALEEFSFRATTLDDLLRLCAGGGHV